MVSQISFRHSRGFTFIEMLLATAIFALVGLASVAVLSTVTRTDELSRESSQRLTQLQHAMLMLERDFMQISLRHVRINGEAPQKNRLIGEKFLLDCGLFQGLGRETDAYNAAFGFEAKALDYVILSHAHIDHSGLLPKLAAEGFKGKIYCTPATKALTEADF